MATTLDLVPIDHDPFEGTTYAMADDPPPPIGSHKALADPLRPVPLRARGQAQPQDMEGQLSKALTEKYSPRGLVMQGRTMSDDHIRDWFDIGRQPRDLYDAHPKAIGLSRQRPSEEDNLRAHLDALNDALSGSRQAVKNTQSSYQTAQDMARAKKLIQQRLDEIAFGEQYEPQLRLTAERSAREYARGLPEPGMAKSYGTGRTLKPVQLTYPSKGGDFDELTELRATMQNLKADKNISQDNETLQQVYRLMNRRIKALSSQ